MSKKQYDFSGWATVHGLKCSDGRIIHKDAFKENDGKTVPLVWNHDHQDVDKVLGHALLENRDKGVYAYCSLNETERGKNAKELIKHGDVCSLSIYANRLVQKGSDVTHGTIREVSLVLAGANPGAYIDNVIVHGEVSQEDACIYNPEEEIEIITHSDSQKTNEQDSDEPQKAVEKSVEKTTDKDETIQDVFDTLNEKQKNVVYIMLSQIIGEENTVEGTKKMTIQRYSIQKKVEKHCKIFSIH